MTQFETLSGELRQRIETLLAAPKSLVAPEHRGGGDEGGESAKPGCRPAIENHSRSKRSPPGSITQHSMIPIFHHSTTQTHPNLIEL